MNTYKITFQYDGSGEIILNAKSKKEAEELFYNGDWENKDVDDTSSNFEIIETNKLA